MKYEVRRICCVCKKFLGYADWKADEPGLETHTYCDPCAEAEMAAFEREHAPTK